jgi:hypothetical protein
MFTGVVAKDVPYRFFVRANLFRNRGEDALQALHANPSDKPPCHSSTVCNRRKRLECRTLAVVAVESLRANVQAHSLPLRRKIAED